MISSATEQSCPSAASLVASSAGNVATGAGAGEDDDDCRRCARKKSARQTLGYSAAALTCTAA